MNERVYKSSSFKVIRELISLVFGCSFLLFVLHFFIDDRINLGIVVTVFILFLFMIIKDRKLYVKVTDETITVVHGKKIDEYRLDECSIEVASQNGDIMTLYITDLIGETKSFDISFLGYRQFNSFIEDVGVVGEKAESISLKAE